VVLADDAFGDGEAEAGTVGVEAGGDEDFEDFRQDVLGNPGTIILHGDGKGGTAVKGGGTGGDVDTAAGVAGVHGVEGVSEEVDEDLDELAGVAEDAGGGGDGVEEGDGGGAFVDGDELPGLFDEFVEGDGGEFAAADAGKVEQTGGDVAEAFGDAFHAEEAGLGGGVGEGFLQFFEGAVEDGEGGIHFVGDAGAEEAEGDEAVLGFEVAFGGFELLIFGFEAVEGLGEVVFLLAEDGDSFVTGVHDLADFVAGDVGGGDEFLSAVAAAGGGVGVEHQLEGLVDVAGHDEEFEEEDGEDVEGAEDGKEGEAGGEEEAVVEGDGQAKTVEAVSGAGDEFEDMFGGGIALPDAAGEVAHPGLSGRGEAEFVAGTGGEVVEAEFVFAAVGGDGGEGIPHEADLAGACGGEAAFDEGEDGEVDAESEDEEESVVENHQLRANAEVAEAAAEAGERAGGPALEGRFSGVAVWQEFLLLLQNFYGYGRKKLIRVYIDSCLML
jgi:hypothetical protein